MVRNTGFYGSGFGGGFYPFGAPAGASETLNDVLRGFKRQALHAVQLGLQHPRTGEEMMFDAPWPADFSALVDMLRAENAAY